ncbi:MAG: alpha/beta hydrolase [Rothia sp. (in: high G+C Gram-positive bacteria)]|uniref:alpha/beta hydrolase n=1 Tax=Rothia sp. (in: high G+C Gram-positive bacteria) TaxID=1885016 RepID=UPI0026E1107B|nr:alpha/beta hydrolase [Rothia sp. (in: high G+C Gram-positive bacteria)]MDO5750164.1 alpha/beta hydrolase [Rothia sp. (in: high G+C Gram-positive bacteria)]
MSYSESVDTRTFEIYPQINARKVRFTNRYGIELVGDLYLPEGFEQAAPASCIAIVVSGAFGAVKEQTSGFHAQELAARGFVTLAFDPSFTGESGGASRDIASPEIFTEDFSAAVDFMGTLPQVNREAIAALGICGLSGMALTAASVDPRIKAVAVTAMYDMSRSIADGFMDSYSDEQRRQVLDYLAAQRWAMVDSGDVAFGPHEMIFDESGTIHPEMFGLPKPEQLPAEAPEMLKRFAWYYRDAAEHPRSVNSTTGWVSTTPLPFFAFPQYRRLAAISPRPVLFITGENAHSRYYSEDAYAMTAEPKELIVVPDADHVSLYYDKNLIPFDTLASFYRRLV